MFSVLAIPLAIVSATGLLIAILQNGGIEWDVNNSKFKVPEETLKINVTHIRDASGNTKNLLFQISGSPATLDVLIQPDLLETIIQMMHSQPRDTTDAPFTLTDYIFQKVAINEQKRDGDVIAWCVVCVLAALLLIAVFYIEYKLKWTSNGNENASENAPASTTSSTDESSSTSG